ncbi:DUF6157 family protein [Adhaeribacter pallidiroseus]|uniref:Uncharacterized protein n=1 Tax=Adhaeribacter pallidiroseus TaxID=2072847 RepID=A0A369QQ30_9BACT|nr:DUF6157 family protein [Adhaeribacter pallidiroseus]RDC64959.1 hypothetical protein AHMF7616_03581 [Adhaeribacter pallidiroseus]
MKIHSTNYQNTFIQVADDCPATKGEIPLGKKDTKTVAQLQFELISQNPYRFTSDDVLFQVFAQRNNLTATEQPTAREQFFAKGQPCFRASPLTKQYGWGIHHNQESKIALYGRETTAYEAFTTDKALKVVKAMKISK